MKILSAPDMKWVDEFTIKNEPVASIDLMERAAKACADALLCDPCEADSYLICCGPGNNGGDGLAIARLLNARNQPVTALLLAPENALSIDCKINRDRMLKQYPELLIQAENIPQGFTIPKGVTIIDALFGTGLSKPPASPFSDLIDMINNSGNRVVSIDLPSGMFSDRSSIHPGSIIVKASKTLTFQFLKQAMVVGENAPFLGEVDILDIGILHESLSGIDIRWEMTEPSSLRHILKPRNPVSHKGMYGHTLLAAGGKGKMGAAILAARAHVRSGAGLLTVLVPESEAGIIHCAVADAMVETYDLFGDLCNQALLPGAFRIGAGPGMGTSAAAEKLLENILSNSTQPVVLDADALNILAANPRLFQQVPKSSILTPHPGEFRRLAGNWENDFEKLELQRSKAKEWGHYVLLKGYRSSIATPEGHLYFNPTGNPGMAKGGSGDVLTGLLSGLISRGYQPLETLLLGTWLHGRAGDLAVSKFSMEGLCAGDLPDFLSMAWVELVNPQPAG